MSRVSSRSIVRDAAILGGRWHLAGSTIAVAEVRLDHGVSGARPRYAYPGVNAAELAACLAFGFPPIRASSVSLWAGTLVVACACGEDTALAGDLDQPIRCVCGRVQRLRIRLEPLPAERSADGTTRAPADRAVRVAIH